MVGKKKSLLTKIKNAQQCGQSMFDIGCPCHMTYLCAEKEATELSVNLEDIIDISIMVSFPWKIYITRLHGIYKYSYQKSYKTCIYTLA